MPTLDACCVPGIGLEAGDAAVYKADEAPALSVERQTVLKFQRVIHI